MSLLWYKNYSPPDHTTASATGCKECNECSSLQVS